MIDDETSGEPKGDAPRAGFEKPGFVTIDHAAKKVIVFTEDMLINQLTRDGPAIEASFDRLCDHDLRDLSRLFANTMGLLHTGITVSSKHDDKLQSACAVLLLNASSSYVSAVGILRMGYLVQPGIVIRSMLEAISTVLHLIQNPDDLAAFEAHTLQSPRTIAAAKKAIPLFGKLYGHFSDNFAHIGPLHKTPAAIVEFKERHAGLETNLYFLRMALWLFYVTSELLFLDIVEPRYWRRVTGGFAYDPSESERAWMAEFLRGTKDGSPLDES